MGKEYTSDISREQFEMIRKDIEAAKKETHSQKYDMHISNRFIRSSNASAPCSGVSCGGRVAENFKFKAIPHNYCRAIALSKPEGR